MIIKLREKIYSYEQVMKQQKVNSYYLNPIGNPNSKFIKEKIHILKLRELNGIDDSEDEKEQTVSYFEEYGLDEDYSISRELLNKIYDGEKLNPIVVDENYEILDGFHRLASYSELYFNSSIDPQLEIFRRIKP